MFTSKYGLFLYKHEGNSHRFENSFAEIEIVDNKMEVSSSYKIDKQLKEILGIQMRPQMLSDEQRMKIVKALLHLSIDVTEIVKELSSTPTAPFASMKEQYRHYNLLILTVPERILIKLKEYLTSKNVKYRFWHRWLKCNYLEMLIDEIDNRLKQLSHTETVNHYYTRHDKILYPWIMK